MREITGLVLAALCSIFCASPAASAGPVTFGTVGPGAGGNCIPFNCATGLYQEEYFHNYFPGVVEISTVSFFPSEDVFGTRDTAIGDFTLTFYYTSGILNADPAANRGQLISNFGTFHLSGDPMNGPLSFTGNPFTYDPVLGDLLLEVSSLNAVSTNNLGDLQENGSGTTERWTGAGDPFSATDFAGSLVTEFSPGSVPEPSTWAMMLLGFTAIGLALRQRAHRFRAASV